MGDELKLILANLSGTWERKLLNGRPHWVGPASMIVPGVLNGSKGPLLYRPEDIIRSVPAWNGMPITLGHPKDEHGSFVSARKPEVEDKYGIGRVYETTYNGKLTAQVWLDEELARKKAPAILNAIANNLPVELSTGLGTTDLATPGTWNGKSGQRQYTHVATEYQPDHLAILLDQKGACSVSDGCGMGVNLGMCPECGEDTQDCECPRVEGTGAADNPLKVKAIEPVKINTLTRMWQQVLNAFLPSQGRSEVTGRIKKRNAGQGKGECHEGAQDGYYGSLPNHEKPGTEPEPQLETVDARNHGEHDQQSHAGGGGDRGTERKGLLEKAKKVAQVAGQKKSAQIKGLLQRISGLSGPTLDQRPSDKAKVEGYYRELEDLVGNSETAMRTNAGFYPGSKRDGMADVIGQAFREIFGTKQTVTEGTRTKPKKEKKPKKTTTTPAPPTGNSHVDNGDVYGGFKKVFRETFGTPQTVTEGTRTKPKKPKKSTTTTTTTPTPKTPTANYIRMEDGKHVVYSEAGKKLGEHDTHAEAVAQLKAVEANKNGARNSNDPEDDMNRKEKVALLVNCACGTWKGKEAVLNDAKLFSDADIDNILSQLKTNERNALVVNSLAERVGVNAEDMPAFIKEKMKDEDEDDEDEDEDEDEEKTTNMNLNALTPEQRDQLSRALFGQPVAAVSAGLSFATNAEKARRKELVTKLVANAGTAEQRKIAAGIYSKLPLSELESLVHTLPGGVRNRAEEDQGAVFLGMTAPQEPTVNYDYTEADFPPDIVLNFDKKSKSAEGSRKSVA